MNTLVTSLFLSCVLGSPAALPSTRTQPLLQEDEAFQALEKEYDRVAREWRSQVRAAKKADDAAAEEALLARNPVKEYYPRFAALADDGSALASLWAATRVEDVETDAAVVKTRKASLFPRAIAGLAATGEAKDLLKELSKPDEFLGPQTLEGFCADFAKATKDEELGAKALHEGAKSMMERAASDEDRAKAVA